MKGSLKSYLMIAFTFGVKKLIFCVNKMDLCEYEKERYQEVQEYTETVAKKVGYNLKNIKFVPVSASENDNIAEKSKKMSWYKGPTLMDLINSAEGPKRYPEKPFRMTVTGFVKITGIGIVVEGKIEYGTIKPGSLVRISP